ncbi:hypothetical protein [Streptomyces violaceusniger]|uniref:Uncharacterized protein n=1 Tax=Streptomyces violaceusniger (strain Tu 4113) TaxID=653045 RepID=G2PHJ7_STRV4|nr:hypothetical protein [Streptomyces violaceusniger]AEM89000.1 hypothetical protein Strvi_0227 [Streptomyces violaceusniger Tu 4113]
MNTGHNGTRNGTDQGELGASSLKDKDGNTVALDKTATAASIGSHVSGSKYSYTLVYEYAKPNGLTGKVTSNAKDIDVDDPDCPKP